MQTYKVETVLKQSGTLVLEQLPFQAGDHVEVLVIPQPSQKKPCFSPANWPTLQGGQFLGIAVRRENIYDDAR
jgi:hypothetical protein